MKPLAITIRLSEENHAAAVEAAKAAGLPLSTWAANLVAEAFVPKIEVHETISYEEWQKRYPDRFEIANPSKWRFAMCFLRSLQPADAVLVLRALLRGKGVPCEFAQEWDDDQRVEWLEREVPL